MSQSLASEGHSSLTIVHTVLGHHIQYSLILFGDILEGMSACRHVEEEILHSDGGTHGSCTWLRLVSTAATSTTNVVIVIVIVGVDYFPIAIRSSIRTSSIGNHRGDGDSSHMGDTRQRFSSKTKG